MGQVAREKSAPAEMPASISMRYGPLAADLRSEDTIRCAAMPPIDPAIEFGTRHGVRDEIALRGIAPMFEKAIPCGLSLDAFGHCFHAKGMAQVDGSLGDRRCIGIMGAGKDKRFVDFETADGKSA